MTDDATTLTAAPPGADGAAGRSAALDIVPPPDLMMAIGAIDRAAFERVGAEFMDYIHRLTGLRPDEHLLDIGCGCGRMAIPLTGHLAEGGHYDGFDVWQPGIDWCREHITSQRPEFQFQRLDIWNAFYNPLGPSLASDYRWPYEDDTFDVVIAMSVFTHLAPRDAAHYVAEMGRVLKPGGRCLSTWFLLSEISRDGLDKQISTLYFQPHPVYGKRCYILNPEAWEQAVAYDQDRVVGYFEQGGLGLPTVYAGGWSYYGGLPSQRTFRNSQDIILAVKPGAADPVETDPAETDTAEAPTQAD
jgi:SAM-dependent methyltransferase